MVPVNLQTFPARTSARAAIILFLFLLVSVAQPPQALAQAVLSDKPDVQAALDRFTGGFNYQSEAQRLKDRALLFANNDAINMARLNNEIPDAAYQAAQKDFSNLNQSFAEESAKAAGANFKVQKSSSPEAFKPGTDSDYITEVTSKDQIGQMQEGYNKRVNEFLEKSGVPEQRSNWHNQLDTDFMADPEFITDPEEFREIARMNNDAYKSRYAAEYEALSRANDGKKIGPQHVNGYLEEMNAFSQKKGRKIEEMLAKGPSYFNDPANRAELFQAMAQEQKYNSRLEALDDFLRQQEGLPPRNRGLTSSKLGSNRNPSNASHIRAGHAVADAARFDALEDLAETMGQVAKKNPDFNGKVADDIAQLLEKLPAERRPGVLARIRANGSPGLVDDIVEASARAGRMPPGSSLADDVARAGSKMDDAARVADAVDDLAAAGTGRGAFGKVIGALEAIGKAADRAEVAIAAARLAGLFSDLNHALDPDTPAEEAQALLEKIRETAADLRNSAALGAIMQRHPAVAAVYGVWALGCAGGEFVSPSKDSGPTTAWSIGSGSCLDRQMSAWDRAKQDFNSWWTGNPPEHEAHAQALCHKLVAGLRAGRYRMKDDWTWKEACQWIRYGNSIGHMVEQLHDSESETADGEDGKDAEDKQPEIALAPASCDPSVNDATIAGLRQAASDGHQGAIGHITRLEAVNAAVASVHSGLERASSAYRAGRLDNVRTILGAAGERIDWFEGDPACPELSGRIATALEKTDRLEGVLDRARGSLESCDPRLLGVVKEEYEAVTLPPVQDVLRQADAIIAANAAMENASAAFRRGDFAAAERQVSRAERSLASVDKSVCTSLRDRLRDAPGKIDRLRDAIRTAEQAVIGCDLDAMSSWRRRLAKVTNPAASAVRRQLEKGPEACRERQRQERIADAERRCKASFGPRAVADPRTAASDDPHCECEKGYQIDPDQRSCVKAPTAAEIAAANDAACRREHGSGYYAGKQNSDGRFHCLPTQATANAWCRANNQGPGLYAGKVKADGSFACRRTRKGERQIALDNCRRQYGRSFVKLVRRNGHYLCEYSRGRTARRPQPRQPSHSARDSAAVIGAIGGVIGAIGNAASSSNRSEHRARPRVTPQQRTTTRRTPSRGPSRAQCVSHMSGTSQRMINQTDQRCRKYW